MYTFNQDYATNLFVNIKNIDNIYRSIQSEINRNSS